MSEQGGPPRKRVASRPGAPPAGRDPSGRSKRSAPAPQSGGDDSSIRTLTGLDGEQQKVVGGFLVGLAIVIGVVLLVRGFSDDGGLTAAPTTTSPTVTVPEGDRDQPPTVDPEQPETTPPPAAPAEVPVLVANATGGIAGAAGTVEAQITEAGYPSAGTVNAGPVPSTQIYYVEGRAAEAEGVATALGVDVTSVALMPDPPPVPDLSGASVVVLVGPELVS